MARYRVPSDGPLGRLSAVVDGIEAVTGLPVRPGDPPYRLVLEPFESGSGLQAVASTSATKLANASAARATGEYSLRSRNSVQDTGGVASLGVPNEKKPAPRPLSFSS